MEKELIMERTGRKKKNRTLLMGYCKGKALSIMRMGRKEGNVTLSMGNITGN